MTDKKIGPRNTLLYEFEQRKRRNSSYSLRAFSRDLGVSLTALSDFMNGKRTLSQKNSGKIAAALKLSASDTKNFLQSLVICKGDVSDDTFTLVSNEDFAAISRWQNFAILCLADLKTNKADPVWVSKKLNLPVDEARRCMVRLQRLGLLVIEDDRMKGTNINLRTPTDVASSSLRRLQHDHLELAQKSLEETPLDKRDMTSITMAVDPKKMKGAKLAIQSFRRRFCKKFENTGADEVYTLAIQFFPLTKTQDRSRPN